MLPRLRYPVVIGVIDVGLGGVLFVVAPVLGVLMAAVGALVVGTAALRRLDRSRPAPRSRPAYDASR